MTALEGGLAGINTHLKSLPSPSSTFSRLLLYISRNLCTHNYIPNSSPSPQLLFLAFTGWIPHILNPENVILCWCSTTGSICSRRYPTLHMLLCKSNTWLIKLFHLLAVGFIVEQMGGKWTRLHHTEQNTINVHCDVASKNKMYLTSNTNVQLCLTQ